MVGTGGGNSGLVNGDNSAVGVSDQAVESRGVSSSIDGGGSSSSVDTSNNSLGCQVIGTGGVDIGLINGDNCAIWEGLESIEALGGGGGNTSGENLEKRDIVGTCICPLIVLL